jgi:uncharacterized protein YfaS (alpha-2-macroglobulin family)
MRSARCALAHSRTRPSAPLTELATSGAPRIDQAVAAAIVRDLLMADFGFDPTLLPPAPFDVATYPVQQQQQNDAGETIAMGLPLLPYGSADARLTARVALGLTRKVTPAGIIGSDALVVVELTPTFDAQAISGAYEVVDLVPSGLAPVARTDGWVGQDGTIGPYRIVGQEVDFSVWYDPHTNQAAKLRYLARIVTPGDYAWESAPLRLAAAPEDAAFTVPTRVTVADR